MITKSTFRNITAILFFAVIFIGTAAAQQSTKKQVFEFTVTGMKTAEDAALLDSAMMKKKGIYSSKTDFATKKIKVETASFMEFKMLNTVVVSKGFEAEGKDLVVKTQDQ